MRGVEIKNEGRRGEERGGEGRMKEGGCAYLCQYFPIHGYQTASIVIYSFSVTSKQIGVHVHPSHLHCIPQYIESVYHSISNQYTTVYQTSIPQYIGPAYHSISNQYTTVY